MATLPVQENQVENIPPEQETISSLNKAISLDAIARHKKKQEEELQNIQAKQKEIKELADLQDLIQNLRSENPDSKSFKIDDATKQKLDKAKELGVRVPEVKNGELTSGQLDSLDRSISTSIENKNTDIQLMFQKTSRATNLLNEIITAAKGCRDTLKRAKASILRNIKL